MLQFHIRTEGLIFSGGSIGYKVGTGITGAFITWLSLLLVLSMYKLDKEYPAIMEELAKREARGEM